MIGDAPLKYEQRTTPNGIVFSFETNENYEVRYTTDGSEPKENGGLYNGEFPVSDTAKFVRVVALYDGKVIAEKQIPVDRSGKKAEEKKIDLTKSVFYRLKAKKQNMKGCLLRVPVHTYMREATKIITWNIMLISRIWQKTCVL